jgi:two-component system, OmpR family, phosphate regulon sensor histidine kinase PhoR
MQLLVATGLVTLPALAILWILAPWAAALAATLVLPAIAAIVIGRLLRDGERQRRAAEILAATAREEAARRGAELATLEAVLAAVPDPLVVLGPDRRVLKASRAALDLVGQDPVGRDLAASLRHPSLLAAADEVLRAGGQRTVEFDYPGTVERRLRAIVVGLDSIAALVFLRDITGASLTERVHADFVARASHELRTPLASITGLIETLGGPARDDEAARERFLGIMHEQAQRMMRLVNDLLSLSRIETAGHQAPTARVELGDILRRVVDALSLPAAARDMRVVLELPAEPPSVVGSPDELVQVFQNLIDNAIKYGRAGTAITVTAAPAVLEDGREALAVAVHDAGEGIRPEHLPRLTERFYRAEEPRGRSIGGTGLGLAIVDHVVRRHRGKLDIASELGTGSVFTVTLPAAGQEGGAHPNRPVM